MFSCEGKLTVFGQAGPFSFTYYRFFFACDLDGICIYGSLSFVPGRQECECAECSYLCKQDEQQSRASTQFRGSTPCFSLKGNSDGWEKELSFVVE